MTENSRVADERLVRDTLAGRQEAFSLLVERYHAAMHALAFAQTGNHADADDVAQEGFLKAYRSLNGLRDARKFGGWLAAIVRNKARSFTRQRQQRAEVAIAPDTATAPSDVETRELRELLKGQIDLLDEAQREVLLLHYFADMNAREIGEVLGLSKFAVQKRLQRARDVLGNKVVDLLGGEVEHRQSAAARNRQIMGLIAAMPLPWAVSSAQAATTVLGVPAVAFKLAVASVVVASAVIAVGAFIGLPLGSVPKSETTATQEQIAWLAANSTAGEATTTEDSAPTGVAPNDTIENPDIVGVAIYTESGKGVPDIPVRMRAEGARDAADATTDADGQFTFADVPAGEYLVGVDRGPYVLTGGEPGFEFAGPIDFPVVRVRVRAEEPVPGLRLEVARGGVITGRVLDKDTRLPLSNVHAHADFVSVEGWRITMGTLAQSDANGQFTIEGLSPSDYVIACDWGAGRGTAPEERPAVAISESGEVLNVGDILIEYGLSVTGRVIDQSGKPVEDAAVWGRWRTANDLRSQTAKSDATGVFELKGGGYRSGGRLFVQASKGRELSAIDGPKAIAEGGLKDIVLTLAVGASIVGIVTDASGTGLADATVTAAYEPDRLAEMVVNDDHIPPGALGFGKDTRTGPDGSYRVEGLHPGNYGIHVKDHGEKPAENFTMAILKRVYVEPGQDLTGINLVIGQPEIDGPAISGTVRDASGQPLAKVHVTAYLPTGFLEQPAQTDDKGAYQIGGLQGGPFSIRAEQPGFSPASAEGIEIGASNVDLMLLPSGSIEGQVVRADNGAPVTEFEIATINRVTDDFSSLRESFKPVSDSQGRFHLEDLSAGDHTIFVKARSFIMGSRAIENLQPGQALSNVVMPLETADPISGIVVTDTGAPVPNAMILTPSDRIDFARQGLETSETRTGSDGRFTLDTLVPDLQRVIAVHRDFAPGIAAVPASGSGRHDVRIVLTQGGSVEGTVSGIDDVVPGAMVHVRAWYPDEPEKGPIDIPCEPDGTFAYSHLALGTVELTAGTVLREPSLSIKKMTTIVEGETTIADFAFEAFDAAIEGTVAGAGKSWTRANVVATSVGADGVAREFFVNVGADGRYRIDGVPEGPVTLLLRATTSDDEVFSREAAAETVSGQVTHFNFEP